MYCFFMNNQNSASFEIEKVTFYEKNLRAYLFTGDTVELDIFIRQCFDNLHLGVVFMM